MTPPRSDGDAPFVGLREGVCDLCGCCVGVCPDDAITLTVRALAIDAGRCSGCARCVWVCPFEALFQLRREEEHARPV